MSDEGPLPPTQPKLLDVAIICCLIPVILAGGPWLFGSWAGQARFLLVEVTLFIMVAGYCSSRGWPLLKTLRIGITKNALSLEFILLSLSTAILLDELDRLTGMVMPPPPEYIQYLSETFHIGSLKDGVWLGLGLGVAGPVAEEALFRGLIQQVFERLRGPTTGVLFASLIFALMHFQPWQMVQLLILSVLLGYLTWRSGSILPAIVVHAVNNLWSLFVISSTTEEWLKFYIWHGHLNPAIIICSLFVFFVFIRRFESHLN